MAIGDARRQRQAARQKRRADRQKARQKRKQTRVDKRGQRQKTRQEQRTKRTELRVAGRTGKAQIKADAGYWDPENVKARTGVVGDALSAAASLGTAAMGGGLAGAAGAAAGLLGGADGGASTTAGDYYEDTGSALPDWALPAGLGVLVLVVLAVVMGGKKDGK